MINDISDASNKQLHEMRKPIQDVNKKVSNTDKKFTGKGLYSHFICWEQKIFLFLPPFLPNSFCYTKINP
jgi:hypothetical protein